MYRESISWFAIDLQSLVTKRMIALQLEFAEWNLTSVVGVLMSRNVAPTPSLAITQCSSAKSNKALRSHSMALRLILTQTMIIMVDSNAVVVIEGAAGIVVDGIVSIVAAAVIDGIVSIVAAAVIVHIPRLTIMLVAIVNRFFNADTSIIINDCYIINGCIEMMDPDRGGIPGSPIRIRMLGVDGRIVQSVLLIDHRRGRMREPLIRIRMLGVDGRIVQSVLLIDHRRGRMREPRIRIRMLGVDGRIV